MALDDPLIGKKLGDYTIQDLLGRGGMSRVYRGYDENLDRYAAVKVISGDFVTTTEEEYTRRFQSEARAIARLRNPNIVGVYQFGRTEGIYYMAQVFLEGKDLRSLIKEYADRHRRIPPDEVLRIVRDVAIALDYAHEQGVIHRDIKPSNIMLEKKTGRAILMDFGLALSIQEGTMGDTFGSAHYIAPEQAVSSAKAVPQSDLYSLGIVLYEMLAGRVPFDDPSVMSVALKHLNELPPPPTMYNPDLLPAVERVVLRVLDKDPRRRHANGKELIDDLERAFDIDRPGDAPDVQGSPPVVDMLDSRTRPPSTWDQPAAPVEPSRPSASTPARMHEREEPAAVGGLARRFARRKERKEEEAALQSITEDSLRLDNATLDSLLDSMPDPSEIGLVGAGARGITHPERPGPISHPSAPAVPHSGPVDVGRRRSRLGLLLPLILVLAIVAGGLYFSGLLGGGDEGDDRTPTLSGTRPAETAVAAAGSTATAAATQAAIAPSETAAVDETPTEPATSAPTRTRVVPSSQTPAQTPTGEPIFTPVPSRTPTEEAPPTAEPTDEPTAAPTDDDTTAVVAVPVARAPNMRAMYDNGHFLLLNRSGQMLDITQVVFEQPMPDGSLRTLRASAWNRSDITIKPNRMAADSCYLLLTGDENLVIPASDVCPFYLGYFRTTVLRNHFWISQEPGAVFTVRLETMDHPLAECPIAAGTCDFYVGPDAADAVITAPTPTPTIAVPAETNILLVYDRVTFLLVNTSQEAVDISRLVFKQELPTGSERVFLAQEWDESPGLLGDLESLRAGGCYELVTSAGNWVRPEVNVCPTFLGWFRSNVIDRYFWVSTLPDAVFTVQLVGDPSPLMVCPISAGECRFYLPPPDEE